MKTIVLLMSFVGPVPADQELYTAAQEVAPLQMIYDATAEDLNQTEAAPLIEA